MSLTSRVLDLEEYLMRRQFMKYNLRFYWKSPGRDNSNFEDYGHAFIRTFSNIACYQLDRNTFEAELLRRNRESPRLEFCPGADELDVTLNDDAPHVVAFSAGNLCAAAQRGERETKPRRRCRSRSSTL